MYVYLVRWITRVILHGAFENTCGEFFERIYQCEWNIGVYKFAFSREDTYVLRLEYSYAPRNINAVVTPKYNRCSQITHVSIVHLRIYGSISTLLFFSTMVANRGAYYTLTVVERASRIIYDCLYTRARDDDLAPLFAAWFLARVDIQEIFASFPLR